MHRNISMSDTLDERAFVERVASRLGGGTASDARRAIFATLSTLAECLADRERAMLASALGPSLAPAAQRGIHAGSFDADELFARVSRREDVPPGFAREHAEVVLVELARALPDPVRAHLGREVSPSIAARFAPPHHGDAPPHEHRAPAAFAHTLAAGNAGSASPVSTARPPIAQSHSVVREDNPHGDTKLSSSEGLTQERLDESLANAEKP